MNSSPDQLELFTAADCYSCPACGHTERLHYRPGLIREDRRGCRAFTCYCPGWKRTP